MQKQDEKTQAAESPGDAAKKEQLELSEATMSSVRKTLPDTRQSVTHKFSVCGTEGYIIAGLFDDAAWGRCI